MKEKLTSHPRDIVIISWASLKRGFDLFLVGMYMTYTKLIHNSVLSNYESKFILDSFLFRVSPARFLRRLAAIINIFPRSRVCLVTYLALTRGDLKTIGFYR
jgi:hypothetical protein